MYYLLAPHHVEDNYLKPGIISDWRPLNLAFAMSLAKNAKISGR